MGEKAIEIDLSECRLYGRIWTRRRLWRRETACLICRGALFTSKEKVWFFQSISSGLVPSQLVILLIKHVLFFSNSERKYQSRIEIYSFFLANFLGE